MNQRKTAKKEPELVPETTTVNHFSNILKSGEANKLGTKSTGKVLYEIAQNDEEKQLYIRLAGQTQGSGLHSKEWVPLNALFDLIEAQEDKPWKSQLYRPLFKGGSANNHGFCAAVTRELGLAQKSGSSVYLHVKGKKYQARKEELLKLAEVKTK